MNSIVQFVPLAERDAKENLNSFARLCKERLTIFGADLDWDALIWDVTKTIARRGIKSRLTLVWSNHDTSKYGIGKPMRQPFLDFARGYMRYQQGMRPTKNVGMRMSALRALERALAEQHGIPELAKVNPGTFNRAAQLVKEKFTTAAAYRIGAQLELVVDFISKNRFTAAPFKWKSPLRRPQDRNRVGKDADELRTRKMPTKASLDALARAFVLAREAADVIVASSAALLCAAPDRINELFRLPEDCEVTERRRAIEEAYGLRWWPSKGAPPMVKWIVQTMSDVAKEAVRKLLEQTSEARRIAQWYETNPDRIYLPSDLEHLRTRNLLDMREVGLLLGFANANAANAWLKWRNVPTARKGRRIYCALSNLEKAVVLDLPKGFPVLDPETGLKYSEALFVVQRNVFHQRRGTSRCMVDMVSIQAINDGLGAGCKHGKSSLFTRLGFTEPDGKPIKITTHQFRHWLNTLAQKGGLSQLDIAKWSGRKDVRQNEAYDHMTADELLAKVRDIDDGHMFGPLAEFVNKAPVSREEYLRISFPTAHTTELGFCIHDWTMLPCQRHRDCINCNEHVCVKGDMHKTNRIKQCLRDAEGQLQRAVSAAKDNYAGADRWLEHHKIITERLRGLVQILDDPAVPYGSIIQLSNKNEFSLIGRAVDDRLRLGDAGVEMLRKIRSGQNVLVDPNKSLPDSKSSN